MDRSERLAAYLVGELDADEHAAVEAALARDPELRSRLDALRRADAALLELRGVEPRSGFSDRLRASLEEELDRLERVRQVPTAASRSRFRLPTWLVPAAAAALVLVVGGITVTSMVGSSGDDSGEPTAGVAADGGGASAEAESADTMAAASDEAAGPVVVSLGRVYDAHSLDQLADQLPLRSLADRGLSRDLATAAAREYARDLGVTALEAGVGEVTEQQDVEETAAPDLPPDDGAEPAAGTLGAARIEGDPDPEDLAAVAACLAPLLVDADDAEIPAYAEIATFDDERAIVYGFVTGDPTTGTFDRVELWVVAREDCFPLQQRSFNGDG